MACKLNGMRSTIWKALAYYEANAIQWENINNFPQVLLWKIVWFTLLLKILSKIIKAWHSNFLRKVEWPIYRATHQWCYNLLHSFLKRKKIQWNHSTSLKSFFTIYFCFFSKSFFHFCQLVLFKLCVLKSFVIHFENFCHQVSRSWTVFQSFSVNSSHLIKYLGLGHIHFDGFCGRIAEQW